MKRMLLMGAILICLVVAMEMPGRGVAQNAASWSTFHGDGQRSGVLNVNGPKDLTALQIYQLAPGIIGSPAIGSNGVAYIGDDNHSVYALDPTKPTVPRWSFPTGGPVRSSPTLSKDGSTVFVGSEDGHVYALATSDGHKIWDRDLSAPIRSSPLLSNDGSSIVLDTVYGTIYSLSTTDGSSKWTQPCFFGAAAGSLAQSTDGSRLYVATTTDDKMFAFPSSGCGGNSGFTVFYLDAAGVSTPGVDPNGNIWVDTSNGSVLSFTPSGSARGTPYLTFNQTPSVSTEAFSNGNAIIGAGNGYVSAISQSSEQQVWQFQTGGAISASAAITSGNGRIYIGSSDGFLYVLDSNGNLVNKRNTDGPIYSSPAIAPDGTVWVASDSGFVYRFADTPAPPATPVPAPTSTGVPNTATPTATATPLVTSTPIPPTSTPTPTATATPATVPLALTVTGSVKDGKSETITVTSAPNTVVKLRINYPNGDHQSHSVTTDASGKATYKYKQGGSKMTHNKLKATVIAKAGSGSSANSVTATYKIGFGTLDVSAEPRTQSAGKSVGIFVHAKVGSHVSAYLLAPSGRLVNLGSGKTGPKGFATFHYTIARGLVTSKNRKVIVIAKLGGSSAKTTFTVA